MITWQMALLTVALPAVVALLIFGVAWQAWRAGGSFGYWGGAVGVVAAYLVGSKWVDSPIFREGWIQWPASGFGARMPWAVAALGVVGLIDGLAPLPRPTRVGLIGGTIAGVSLFLFGKLSTLDVFAKTDANLALALTLGIVIVFGLLAWSWLDEVGDVAPRLASFQTVLLGTAVAYVLLQGSGARMGQLAGVLTAATGGIMVVCLIRPTALISRGAATVIGPTFMLLIAGGYFLNDSRLLPTLLVAITPLTFLVATMLTVTRMKPAAAAMASTLLGIVPAAIAVALVWKPLPV